MLPMPVSQCERHLEALDDMSDQERFKLLDDETRMKIEEEFLASLDKEDIANAVFAAAGVVKGDTKIILGDYLKQRWGNFLSRELDGYRGRIEAAWMEQNR